MTPFYELTTAFPATSCAAIASAAGCAMNPYAFSDCEGAKDTIHDHKSKIKGRCHGCTTGLSNQLWNQIPMPRAPSESKTCELSVLEDIVWANAARNTASYKQRVRVTRFERPKVAATCTRVLVALYAEPAAILQTAVVPCALRASSTQVACLARRGEKRMIGRLALKYGMHLP
eukprot:2188559-Pleurochrysis_carterae.AAC.2